MSSEDNYLDNLTTNGSCFICLQLIDSFYQKELISLNMLVKYLRIETEEIFGADYELKVKLNELFKVEVCSGCEKNLREFSQLYELLEKTKMEMLYLLGTFQKSIGDSDQDLEVKEAFKNRMESNLERLQLVERVRELIGKKCSERSSGDQAQVILQRLPCIKQELGDGKDDPLDSDYIPTSDDESEESQSIPIPSNPSGEDPLRALQPKPRVDLRVSKYSKYFTKIKSTDGTVMTECKICKKLFSKDLSGFKKHLKRKHPNHAESLINPEIPDVPELPKLEESSSPLVEEIQIKNEDGTDSINPTISDNGRFKCTIPGCKKDYKTKAVVFWHIRNYHKKPKIYINNSIYSDKCREVKTPEGKMVQCNNCQKNFKTMGEFASHYNNVHAPKKYKCSECSWGFASKRNLTVHWKRQHSKGVQIEDPKPDVATTGSKRKSKYEGKFTETVLNGKQVFECNECMRKCNLLGDFITHFNYVHAPRRFICDDCGKPFQTNPMLKRHFRRMHTKPKY